jgi:hypothetical protein
MQMECPTLDSRPKCPTTEDQVFVSVDDLHQPVASAALPTSRVIGLNGKWYTGTPDGLMMKEPQR